MKNFPSVKYDAIFAIEGNRAKYQYNPMLRRQGYAAPEGAYRVQERYGLWLCKDFIPIQKKNEWITRKGYEFTKFHAFFNCQELRLTANRSSVDNTPADVMADIREEIERTFLEIVEGDDWRNIEWLEEESQAFYTGEKEDRDYQARIDRVNSAKICIHNGHTLVEPYRESGVLSLFLELSFLEPDLFPFEIVDYDTYSGIDVVARSKQKLSLAQSRLFYVEFKHLLQDSLNHGMKNLHSIVCWDCSLKHDQEIEDILGETRRVQIVPPDGVTNETRWFL
ncbi:MAG TPA: hypothetical protein VGR45_02570, partial [Stellaceae bacterium]|nr:hypothetical protein [Stellaceae bacterium]